MAVSNRSRIEIYQGNIGGTITKNAFGGSQFGFDNHFIPDGSPEHKTLAELDNIGRKELYSARFKAVRAFGKGQAVTETNVEDIEPWTGEYQKED
jgi:inosine/xanthosine triphosphate pyrophosphatase family protein